MKDIASEVTRLKILVIQLVELTAQEQMNQSVDPKTDKAMREINKIYKYIVDESKENQKTIKDLLGVIKQYERECV